MHYHHPSGRDPLSPSPEDQHDEPESPSVARLGFTMLDEEQKRRRLERLRRQHAVDQEVINARRREQRRTKPTATVLGHRTRTEGDNEVEGAPAKRTRREDASKDIKVRNLVSTTYTWLIHPNIRRTFSPLNKKRLIAVHLLPRFWIKPHV